MIISFVFVLSLAGGFYFFMYERFTWEISGYRSNPDLKTVRPDWKGNPVNPQGRFLNENLEPLPGFSDLLKWQREPNPQKAEKKTDTFRLKVTKNSDFLSNNEDCVVWLGHATFFIRLNGVRILTDPVLESPSALMKRYSALPVAVSELKDMDYIIVSHDHRDHCDEKSLKTLAPQNLNATYLTGLGLDTLLNNFTKNPNIQAAGWYQTYQTDTSKIEIIYLPARHWARRYLNDTNKNLWGAYLIRANGKSIYFGSDSGYGTHYQDFAKYFGGVDVALLGVGAYKPEWFMSASHAGPKDAVRAAHEMKAKRMIPMHYGTFDLSDEPLGDCYRSLQKLQKAPQNQGLIQLAGVGEVIKL
ncbi:Zn-dependent hydrolase [Runella rosea]|uniref:Zn-dependent hydrolase n=1 Tax=Runella rosea TaxID=2259595 RepID=A0A344TM82_9BACT|nr:MBL fold metallo-hydrolase [Runella rosea]AXE19753.1 Zn-dependent hydrolase [Runella rosea]